MYMYSSITDINECDLENDGCQQICINTNGSYNCSCNPGYTLNTDGQFCTGEHYNYDYGYVHNKIILSVTKLIIRLLHCAWHNLFHHKCI